MLDARARDALKGQERFAGKTLSSIGLTANRITVLGIVICAIGSWRIADGALLAGGFILWGGGMLDFCDGAVARYRGTASTLGAFFDSVTDRVADVLVFSGLAWFFFQQGDEWTAAGVLIGYGTSVLTSYIRAKAESLGWDCKTGILERAERLIIICAGLILNSLWGQLIEIAVWLLAAGGLVTVLQRLVYVAKQARVPSASI